MKDIFDFAKATVSLEELEEFYKIKDYDVLCKRVEELKLQGKIKAMNPKDVTGRFPPIPKKYRILRSTIDNSEYIKEMKSMLPTRFSLDFYKKNTESYIEHRKYILPLGDYFKKQKKALEKEMSINERSFDIWQEEKFLKDNPLASVILNNLGLLLEDLKVYKTPEPFFYYSKTRLPGQNILIVENKDTWYSIRKLMKVGQTQFFGIDFGTVIYGEGKKIISSFNEINEHEDEEEYLKDVNNCFFYFGDLDYEGLSIYGQLKSKFQAAKRMYLFMPAYLKMLNLVDIGTLKQMKLEQIKKGSKEFSIWDRVLDEFDQESQKRIKEIFAEGRYVPQEIINFQILKGEK